MHGCHDIIKLDNISLKRKYFCDMNVCQFISSNNVSKYIIKQISFEFPVFLLINNLIRRNFKRLKAIGGTNVLFDELI